MIRRGLAIFSAIVLVLIGGIGIMLAFVFAYSYRVWQTDPQRRPT